MQDRILLSADEAARALGISHGHFYRLHAEGLIPAPVRLGRRTLWRRAELEAWTAAGAPSRWQWENSEEKALTNSGTGSRI